MASSDRFSFSTQRASGPPRITHLRNITQEKAYEIAHIDAQVLHTDDAIIALLNQRAALNRKRNTFVPAVNLPLEVLAIIFEFALCCSNVKLITEINWICRDKSRYDEDHVDDTPAVLTPLFFGTICSAWRDISLGTPKLWKSIKLLTNDTTADVHAAQLCYWFSKSSQYPLSVSLVEDVDYSTYKEEIGEGEVDWDDYDISTKVIDVLALQAHRLHTVDLFLPLTWVPALISIAHCIPLLTCLTLRTTVRGAFLEHVDLFADAPLLREVTLVGYPVENVSLPWAQLERFRGDDIDISDCLQVLRLCPCLRSLVIRNIRHFAFLGPTTSITHVALETLEFFGEHYREKLGVLLETVTLPALRSCAIFPDIEMFSTILLPFFSHSVPALTTLHLVCNTPPEDELVGCLRALPGLRELLLHNPYERYPGPPSRLTQRVLDLMNPTRYEGQMEGQGGEDGAERPRGTNEGISAQCLVPNLESLYYQGLIGFTPHALVEFLVDRWRVPSAECAPGLDHEVRRIKGPEAAQTADECLSANGKASVVRLRSVTFMARPVLKFKKADAAIVRGLVQEGMDLKFIARVSY